MIQATIQGRRAVSRWIQRQAYQAEKDFNTSLRVEAYRLMRLLRSEIGSGAPGGKKMAPLSSIDRRVTGDPSRTSKRMRPNKPLRALARGVGYKVLKRSPMTIAVGWVGHGTNSKSWERLAKKQQAGFSAPASPSMRRLFMHTGAGVKGPTRKHYFLRKSTTELKTEGRPIMKPFWDTHHGDIARNIKSNYMRKRRGERI